MCQNCGCRLSKGIESKKLEKEKLLTGAGNTRLAQASQLAAQWRRQHTPGAGLSDRCAVAQARSRAKDHIHIVAPWRSEIGAWRQPVFSSKNSASFNLLLPYNKTLLAPFNPLHQNSKIST
jgi:hypothetical protein